MVRSRGAVLDREGRWRGAEGVILTDLEIDLGTIRDDLQVVPAEKCYSHDPSYPTVGPVSPGLDC
ncbi:hypothetical protein D3C80_1992870 [compost metagenome]